ncbi:hypothetical protein HPB49_026101 [Dermacentor silvarum]|nr:hypothetical protein HPB49_026101 [Dermacentor silvarum]
MGWVVAVRGGIHGQLGLVEGIESGSSKEQVPPPVTKVWNSVGMVRAHNTAEESSIDVEFHDTSVHHALHRGNTQGHTMAALSEKALVLAGPQQLECLHLGSWDANKEWAVDTLSDGIQVSPLVVCAGK